MNGHGLSERAGWVFAAALVVAGAGGLTGDRPAPTTLDRTSSVGAAVADTSSVRTSTAPLLRDLLTVESAGATPPLGPSLALAADAFTWPSVAPTVTTTVAPKPAAPVSSGPAPVWWSKYHGTNHVWMPTLGINKPVYLFPCSRSRSPDNYVYRWGCAGTNNVYLLGHAYGVFKALHDAYYNGKLRVGMPVVYADGKGRVHLFRVTTWRVTNPSDVVWAYSAQPRLSMTLQTCIGATSQYRLDVRLVAVTK